MVKANGVLTDSSRMEGVPRRHFICTAKRTAPAQIKRIKEAERTLV